MEPIKHDIIAIDVSKDNLEVLSETLSFSVSNDSKGHAKLLKHIAKFPSPLAVCEATGGYERKLVEAIARKAVPYAKLNPARVRNFARSEGIKAKTDPLDARVIQRFAQQKDLRPTTPPEPKRQKLADLLDRRSHLCEHAAREKNRLKNGPDAILSSVRKIIRVLEKEIEVIENRIRKLVGGDAKLKAQVELLLAVKGVGEITAWTLLANLREIEFLKRNEIVALVGIAPFNSDSGKTKGKRRIQEGRAKVRKCLFMAARIAAVYNPVIKSYVERLMARGKPYKCAIVAAMRKLLLHIQSIIKKSNLALDS